MVRTRVKVWHQAAPGLARTPLPPPVDTGVMFGMHPATQVELVNLLGAWSDADGSNLEWTVFDGPGFGTQACCRTPTFLAITPAPGMGDPEQLPMVVRPGNPCLSCGFGAKFADQADGVPYGMWHLTVQSDSGAVCTEIIGGEQEVDFACQALIDELHSRTPNDDGDGHQVHRHLITPVRPPV